MRSSLLTALLAASASRVLSEAVVCKNGAPTGLDANNLPNQTETGQTGYNNCGTKDSQDSMCQTAWINSVDDFCLWAPPSPAVIGESERVTVAWCTKPGHGARLIPDGTITGAHMVVTSEYIQITGIGDLTKINIPQNDMGGELDPHGADGCGNPIGGIVFTNGFGQKNQQISEWTNFMDYQSFCFRICIGDKATSYCQHIYDLQGCAWNIPGNYTPGFDTCKGNPTEPMGVYGTSTWYQGIVPTPSAHTPGATSQCTPTSTIGSGFTLAPTNTPAPTSPASGNNSTSNSTTASSNATTSSSSTTKSSGAAHSAYISIGLATVVSMFAFAAAVLLY